MSKWAEFAYFECQVILAAESISIDREHDSWKWDAANNRILKGLFWDILNYYPHFINRKLKHEKVKYTK